MDVLYSFDVLIKDVIFLGKNTKLKSSDITINISLSEKINMSIRKEINSDDNCVDASNENSISVNSGKSVIFSAKKDELSKMISSHQIVIEVLSTQGMSFGVGQCQIDFKTIESVINANSGVKKYEAAESIDFMKDNAKIGTVVLNLKLYNFGEQISTVFQLSDNKVYFKNEIESDTFQIQSIGDTKKLQDIPTIPVLNTPILKDGESEKCSVIVDKPERNVLVIYTGGTIGMIRNEDGVLAPIPNMLKKKIKSYQTLYDEAYAKQKYGESYLSQEELVLPCCEEACRVTYKIIEYNPLLDSSNMGLNDWIRIAKDIEKYYEEFDGFVILHGTDTLIYTASALSFMFENLGKSVVLTGSQVPIFEIRSDGQENFLSSLIFAGGYVIPEVMICFDHALYRGNRTIKISAANFKAFNSPNLKPLAIVGIKIDVNYGSIFRPNTIEKFKVHTKLNQNVVLLRLFPSITVDTVKHFLEKPTEGAVLQSYGAGNVPSNRKDLLDAFKEAADRGVIIVNTTQCIEGTVEAIYEAGSVLKHIGVISGCDMTAEAALTKLSYVLSKEWCLEKKKEMMMKNIRGELTSNELFDIDKEDLVNAVAEKLNLTSHEDIHQLNQVLCPALVLSSIVDNDLDKLKMLKGLGVDLCQGNVEKRTPLHVACGLGRVEMVRFLLLNGCSVHAKDKDEKTAMNKAIENDQHEIIKMLLQSGAHVCGCELSEISEDLCLAAAVGSLKRLKSYKLAGVSLNLTDKSGRTALHLATLHGHVDIVNFLLNEGCNPDDEDMIGITPKKIAKHTKNTEIINIFSKY